MKRLFAFLLIPLLCAGCRQEPEKSGPVMIYTPHATAAVSSQEEGEEDRTLAKMRDSLLSQNGSITIDCPETLERSDYRVRIDPTLMETIAAALTDSPADPDVTPPAESPDGTEQELSITVQEEDGSCRVYFTGFNGEHPDYPEKAILKVKNAGEASRTYLYDKTVFDAVYGAIQKNLFGVPVSFIGNNVILRSAYDLDKTNQKFETEVKEFLQFGPKLIWRFEMVNSLGTRFSIIEAFDGSTGKSLYSYKLVENIDRMEKASDIAGYDYRIFSGDKVTYKNSADVKAEKQLQLPLSVQLMDGGEGGAGTFDLSGDRLVWAGGDGIHLSDAEGFDPKLTMPNTALQAVMQNKGLPLAPGESSAQFYFNNPRFMQGGKKIAAEIISPQTKPHFLGVAAADIETGEISYFSDWFYVGNAKPEYPDEDTVVFRKAEEATLLNVEDFTHKTIPLPAQKEITLSLAPEEGADTTPAPSQPPESSETQSVAQVPPPTEPESSLEGSGQVSQAAPAPDVDIEIQAQEEEGGADPSSDQTDTAVPKADETPDSAEDGPETQIVKMGYFTADYQSFVVSRQTYDGQLRQSKLEAAVTTAERLEDESYPILTATGDTFYFVAATESYVIGYLKDVGGLRYTCLRYRALPADYRDTAAPSSASEDAQSQEPPIEDDEEGVPPPDPMETSSIGSTEKIGI